MQNKICYLILTLLDLQILVRKFLPVATIENEKLIDEDRIVLKKLVEMVEKLTKRVVDIETS